MFLVALFAVGGTIFNIVGPKVLGSATTELAGGLMAKISGHGAASDFSSIARSCFLRLGCMLSAPA